MSKKILWTQIDPLLHNFEYLTNNDVIYYHLEYDPSGYNTPNYSWVWNYKKDIKYRNESSWGYKTNAIRDFAKLLIDTPFGNNRLLLSAPTSKRRGSLLYDSRNDDVLNIVNKAINIPISFNLNSIKDIDATHLQQGFRSPENLKGFYEFTPFKNVPEIVYIIDDVITSGSHFVVWRNLIHESHPNLEVRGFYLARTVNNKIDY